MKQNNDGIKGPVRASKYNAVSIIDANGDLLANTAYFYSDQDFSKARAFRSRIIHCLNEYPQLSDRYDVVIKALQKYRHGAGAEEKHRPTWILAFNTLKDLGELQENKT